MLSAPSWDALYYYYHSKDDVFVDIMERGWKDLWEGIESRIVEEMSPKKKFLGIILLYKF